MKRAIINAVLGDGHFWRHPESVNSNMVWTSTSRSWLEWKRKHLLPKEMKSRLTQVRRAAAKGCFPNARALYGLKTHVHPEVTAAHDTWTKETALAQMDMFDLAVWFLDDGSTVRRKDTKHSYRVIICVGALTQDVLLPHMSRVLEIPERSLGIVVKNNSRATERNKSWVIPKPAAVQIMREARKLDQSDFAHKVPLW